MSNIEDLISAWQAVDYKRNNSDKGIRPSDTSDPKLLAGCYLDWAGGDLKKAIDQIEVHVSGRYLDCPPFAGCRETLNLLKGLL
jgi:hypothetical protein